MVNRYLSIICQGMNAMENALLHNNFLFCNHRFEGYHYTDSRAGSPMYFIAYMREGTAKIISNSNTLLIREGDVFFIPKALPYQSYWCGKPKTDFLSFGFMGLEARERMHYDLQIIPCSEEMKRRVMQIPTDGSNPSCETLGLFYGAVAGLLPFMQSKRPRTKADEIIERAKQYIRDNTSCSMAEVARSCYISEPYLYLLFKEKTDSTPNAFRLEVICRRGIDYLITTDKTVDEISTLIGLSSSSHFRKILKANTGLTPRQVRKNSSF